MLYTRRELGKLALATLPAAGLAARPLSAFGAFADEAQLQSCRACRLA